MLPIKLSPLGLVRQPAADGRQATRASPALARTSARRLRSEAPPLFVCHPFFPGSALFPAHRRPPPSARLCACAGTGRNLPVKGDERHLGRFSVPLVGNVLGTSFYRLVRPLNVVLTPGQGTQLTRQTC